MQTFKVHQEYRLDYIRDQAKKETLYGIGEKSPFFTIPENIGFTGDRILQILAFNLVKLYEFKSIGDSDKSIWECFFASNESSEFDNEYPFWF